MSQFKSEQQDDLNIVYFPHQVLVSSVEELKTGVQNWLDTNCRVHVLDFSKTKEISPQAFQPLISFRQSLKSQQRQLYSLHLNEELHNYIKAQGLEQVFQPIKNLYEAIQNSSQSQKASLDVNFVNPFLKATTQTLKTQAEIDLKPQKPFLKSSDHKADIALAGVLSLVSEQFTGSITLCFPAKTFLGIYNSMFDEENTEINEEIEDAAGELLNIIYGQAKAELNDKHGYSLQKAIPTVLTADKLNIRQTSGGVTVILPFESPLGPFHIEIEGSKDP